MLTVTITEKYILQKIEKDKYKSHNKITVTQWEFLNSFYCQLNSFDTNIDYIIKVVNYCL